MSIRRFIILLIMAALSATTYLVQRSGEGVDLHFSKELIDLDPRIITGMKIIPVDGAALHFSYSDGTWSLEGSELLLDQTQVRQLGGRLFTLSSMRSVPAAELPEIGAKRGSFELSSSKNSVSVDIFGETLLDQNSYIRIAGDPLVYVVEGNLADILLTDIELLQRRDLFTIPAQKIVELEIAQKHGRILVNQEDGVWKIRQPVMDWVDGQRVGAAISAIAGARATTFVPGAGAGVEELFSAKSADYAVTIKDKSGKSEQIFVIFDKLKAKLYSMIPGSRSVVELDLLLINELGMLANEFRSPYVFVLPAQNFVSLKINWGEQQRLIERREKTMYADNRAVAAKPAVLFVNAILGLKIKSYQTPLGLKRPQSYNSITLITQESSLQVDFWKATDRGYWAQRRGEPHIYRIDEVDLPDFGSDLRSDRSDDLAK